MYTYLYIYIYLICTEHRQLTQELAHAQSPSTSTFASQDHHCPPSPPFLAAAGIARSPSLVGASPTLADASLDSLAVAVAAASSAADASQPSSVPRSVRRRSRAFKQRHEKQESSTHLSVKCKDDN